MIRPLDFFGWPVAGGTVALFCDWHISPDLAARAAGDPIHLGSHVLTESGHMLLFHGPWSRALPGVEGEYWLVVPLSVPATPGRYEIQLDPVVESKFWGSWHGIKPLTLQVDRCRNGDLLAAEAGGSWRGEIRHPRGGQFRIPHSLYGAGETERCVEMPWVLSRYDGERTVLDVGSAHALAQYYSALAALEIPVLVGLDLVAREAPGMLVIGADARFPAVRPQSVELILAISVLAHVGRDTTRYGIGEREYRDVAGDCTAVRALAGLLIPGGRLLVTVPFGRAEDHGAFVQYDRDRLERLISASGLEVAEAEFYRYEGAWRGPLPVNWLGECRYGDRALAATGVACLALRRSTLPGRLHRVVSRLGRAVTDLAVKARGVDIRIPPTVVLGRATVGRMLRRLGLSSAVAARARRPGAPLRAGATGGCSIKRPGRTAEVWGRRSRATCGPVARNGSSHNSRIQTLHTSPERRVPSRSRGRWISDRMWFGPTSRGRD